MGKGACLGVGDRAGPIGLQAAATARGGRGPAGVALPSKAPAAAPIEVPRIRLVGLPSSHGVATSNSPKDPAKSHAGKSPTAPLRSRTINHDRFLSLDKKLSRKTLLVHS